MPRNRIHLALTLATLVALLPAAVEELSAESPDTGKPVKVYILSGQSNMVGIGQVAGGGSRWGSEFLDPVVSVYPGPYDPDANYDAIKPTTALKLKKFGGVTP